MHENNENNKSTKGDLGEALSVSSERDPKAMKKEQELFARLRG